MKLTQIIYMKNLITKIKNNYQSLPKGVIIICALGDLIIISLILALIFL